MKLFDTIIQETMEAAAAAKHIPYEDLLPWPTAEGSELIMRRDAAYELGGSGLPSANYTLVTTDPVLSGSEVLILGQDLGELREDVPFARIVILETEEISEDDEGHDRIRQMEFVRYHVFPKGYMVRVSSTSFEEQVRVSREAVRAGIRFDRIGRAYLDRYLAVPGVKSAKILFTTDGAAVERLRPNAKKAEDITKTLSHILDGLPTDCGHCSLKPVCDEVEGMREMHLGRKS